MSNLAIKRIKVDMKMYHKHQLDKHGIYCLFKEDNIYNVKVMMIGPKDTPYQGGFYMFDLYYPDNYPVNPPNVRFISMSRKARIHPNLYANGKVCLSFLGTWSGPPWTSCLNLNTILLSILSLFNDNPISNEPGYENEKGDRSKLYKSMIDYHNITLYTLEILEYIPEDFISFKPIMNRFFLEHFDDYYNQLKKHENISYYKRNIYGIDALVDYNYVKNALLLYKTICLNDLMNTPAPITTPTPEDISSEIINSASATDESQVVEPKSKRKAPNQKAKDYDNDFELLSENDNRLYKVITTKNGYKRWVPKK
jgi:ubiquitin-protein ligase